MKKILSTVLVCVLLVSTLFVLASCGGKTLVGTYENDTLNTTYEFSALGKVTRTVDSILSGKKITEGKYSFSEEGDKITFTFESEDGEENSETYDYSYGEEEGTKYIKIGLFKYFEID